MRRWLKSLEYALGHHMNAKVQYRDKVDRRWHQRESARESGRYGNERTE